MPSIDSTANIGFVKDLLFSGFANDGMCLCACSLVRSRVTTPRRSRSKRPSRATLTRSRLRSLTRSWPTSLLWAMRQRRLSQDLLTRCCRVPHPSIPPPFPLAPPPSMSTSCVPADTTDLHILHAECYTWSEPSFAEFSRSSWAMWFVCTAPIATW